MIERLDLRGHIVRVILWEGRHKRASAPMLVVGRVPAAIVREAKPIQVNREAYELRTGDGTSIYAYAHELEICPS